jgi:hypothetical protein
MFTFGEQSVAFVRHIPDMISMVSLWGAARRAYHEPDPEKRPAEGAADPERELN